VKLIASIVLSCSLPALAALPPAISLQPLVSGFDRPVQLVDAHDGRPELYVAEQKGLIRIIDNRSIIERPFLDIRSLVSCCSNGGVLSIVFHPQYASNGRFFVQYVDLAGDTVVAEFRRSPTDALIADPTFRKTLLIADQPTDNVPNHHGGKLLFDSNGYLFISIGDGGAYVTVTNRAQDLRHLLGKLLRIDVDHGDPYTIPADNPLVGIADTRAEIWAWGLRNPWRFSFDPYSDLLFLGDVGQDSWEEVNIQPLAATRAADFGWPRMEGTHCFPPGSNCDGSGTLLPKLEYARESGCSVTGGNRYRGRRWNRFSGVYIYGDFCSGRIWGASEAADGSWSSSMMLDSDTAIVSFGEDDDGELYLVDYNGILFMITDPPSVRRRAVTH
jgi:glucose/arabinose dehydrogenase